MKRGPQNHPDRGLSIQAQKRNFLHARLNFIIVSLAGERRSQGDSRRVFCQSRVSPVAMLGFLVVSTCCMLVPIAFACFSALVTSLVHENADPL
jgi:hypothetical protein